MDNNVLSIRFPDGERFVESEPLHQWDYGIKVVIENVDLPSVYEVHFSNLRFDGTSKTVVGSPEGFVIPQEYLESGRDIQAYIYTHATENDGETYYHISIPVIKRAKPTDEEPTPTEQSTMEALIARTTQVVSDTEDAINNIPSAVNNAIANSEIKNEIIRIAGVVEELECGLTEEVKTALLACFEQVAWIGANGQTYYDALETALNKKRSLNSISAVFTQGSTVIYDTDELYALKQYLTVTATYDDGTTKEVNNYTLSGELVAGTSTITVAYNKKITTFNVTVTHQEKTLESISATFSSSASITTDNVLDDLRPYLTVRATYSDGSTNTVTNYTLSGSLNVGMNTITATYSGKTTTFTVNVTQAEKTLQSISAVFNQGSAVIYTDSSLDDLKPYLTVTARYSDGTTQTVTGYTLSGTLAAGTSTITASYGGKTAAFSVNVTETSGKVYYANYDFTESLNDKSGHGTLVLSHGEEATSDAQRTSAGLVFSQPAQVAYFGEIDPVGKTFEFTISNFDFKGNTDAHIRLLQCSNGINGMGPLIYRKKTGYNAYSFWKSDLTDISKAWGNIPWSGLQGSGTSVINSLSGKTVKIVFENEHTVALYLNGVLKSKMTDLYYNTAAGATPTADSRYNKLISFGGTTHTPTASEGDQCYNLTLRDFKIYEDAATPSLLRNWDFTQSLTDSVSGAVAETNATRDSNGLTFNAKGQYIDFDLLFAKERTYEIDVDYIGTAFNTDTPYRRLFAFGENGTDTTANTAAFVCGWGGSGNWKWYFGSSWDSTYVAQNVGASYFDGKTVKIYINNNGKCYVAIKPIGSSDSSYTNLSSSTGTIKNFTNAKVYIGSSGNDVLASTRIKAFRVYEGEK